MRLSLSIVCAVSVHHVSTVLKYSFWLTIYIWIELLSVEQYNIRGGGVVQLFPLRGAVHVKVLMDLGDGLLSKPSR